MAASCWKHALPDIGKNSFGHDEGAAIVLRQKWSCGQVEARFANLPAPVGMEACEWHWFVHRYLPPLLNSGDRETVAANLSRLC
jgi:hypothetical protein